MTKTDVKTLQELIDYSSDLIEKQTLEEVFGITEVLSQSRREFWQKRIRDNPQEYLFLPQFTEISASQASHLGKFTGKFIVFKNLTFLPPLAAKELCLWKGMTLHLNSLTTLSVKTARALSGWNGISLMLNGLPSLTASVAKELAECNCQQLYLNNINVLPRDSAQALFRRNKNHTNHFEILLNSLPKLTMEIATAVVSWSGDYLAFKSVKEIAPLVAATICQWPGKQLDLQNLQLIDESLLTTMMQSKIESITIGRGIGSGPKFVLPSGSELYINNINALSEPVQSMLKPFWLHEYDDWLPN